MFSEKIFNILSEANRLHINEKTEEHENALINLKTKCIKTKFNKTLTNNIFKEYACRSSKKRRYNADWNEYIIYLKVKLNIITFSCMYSS